MLPPIAALGISEITQLTLFFLLAGLGFYHITDDFIRSKFQFEYENEFIARHRDFIEHQQNNDSGSRYVIKDF